MTEQPTWAALFEQAEGHEVTTDQIRQQLAALRSDE